jgi:hypothetical protein
MTQMRLPPYSSKVSETRDGTLTQPWRQWFQFLYSNLTTPALVQPIQAPTASAPAYVKGAIYFDTTLNKLRVGGASGWETITSV